jgi:hypothetical protein
VKGAEARAGIKVEQTQKAGSALSELLAGQPSTAERLSDLGLSSTLAAIWRNAQAATQRGEDSQFAAAREIIRIDQDARAKAIIDVPEDIWSQQVLAAWRIVGQRLGVGAPTPPTETPPGEAPPQEGAEGEISDFIKRQGG